MIDAFDQLMSIIIIIVIIIMGSPRAGPGRTTLPNAAW
jgi:hypothetical protein